MGVEKSPRWEFSGCPLSVIVAAHSPVHGEILWDQEKRENRCSLHGSRGQSRGDSGEGVEGEDFGLDLWIVKEQKFSFVTEGVCVLTVCLGAVSLISAAADFFGGSVFAAGI